MANTKSAKKRVLQSRKRNALNVARKTGIKTAMKKVATALQEGKTAAEVQALFNDAQSKCSRARGKGTLHGNTAARKISRLALKVQKHFSEAKTEKTVVAKVAKKAKK